MVLTGYGVHLLKRITHTDAEIRQPTTCSLPPPKCKLTVCSKLVMCATATGLLYPGATGTERERERECVCVCVCVCLQALLGPPTQEGGLPAKCVSFPLILFLSWNSPSHEVLNTIIGRGVIRQASVPHSTQSTSYSWTGNTSTIPIGKCGAFCLEEVTLAC